MNADQRIVQRMSELIRVGDEVLGTKRVPPPNFIGFDSTVDSQRAYQWFTSAQNILARALGTESEHYKNFTGQETKKGLTYSPVLRAQGILKAALEDLQGGYLFDLRRLIEAEVFDDLLDQAEQLLAAGYTGPAAVVAGCVLEDGLRRLCERHDVALSDRPKLDSMNAELAKTGAYSKLVQKRITALAGIRNSAAHGQWDDFGKSDVTEAVAWIRASMEAWFG